MLACGEASGDLYAGALIEALRGRAPGTEVFGLGGERFAAAGGRAVGDFRGLAVTGLTEALRVVPRSLALLRRLVDEARVVKPDVFVAVDFPDFNFRLMAAVHRLGIPVVYYISPQLWAWRSGRMKTMREYVSRVLVIFPFEEAIYARAGVPVTFVGHPLIDLIRVVEAPAAFRARHGFAGDRPLVALLPGSRRNELARLAPVMTDAVARIRASRPDAQFVIARAPHLASELFRPFDSSIPLVEARTDDVLAASDAVITASGTATVQSALHERPMVVVYRLSPMTYAIGKPFVRVDTYAMPNLVAGRRVVPELIQDACTPDAIATETLRLLNDGTAYAAMRDGLREMKARLGGRGASQRAADAILSLVAERRNSDSRQ